MGIKIICKLKPECWFNAFSETTKDAIGGEIVTFPARILAKFGPNEGWAGGDFLCGRVQEE